MSRRGSFKNELLHHCRYATLTDAEASIREYIEISTTANAAIRVSAILRQLCSHKVSASRRLPIEMRVSTIDRTPQNDHHAFFGTPMVKLREKIWFLTTASNILRLGSEIHRQGGGSREAPLLPGTEED